MGDLQNDDLGFQNTTNPLPEKISATTLTMGSVSMNKSSLGMDSFFASGWDPLVSLSHSENFHGGFPHSFPAGMENQGVSGTTQIVQYPSDSSYVEMVTKLPCFGSGNYSDMFGSFGLPECNQIPTNNGCSLNYAPSRNGGGASERASTNAAQTHDNQQLSGEEATESPDGKRRKRPLDVSFPFSPNKKSEGKLKKDLSGDSSSVQEEKKQEIEHNLGGNSRGKAAGKQTKENSNSEETPKDNYIHVRARRGQATNSHSLAERVRREKISERMRLLQELVPGCNKITGKAVMLDEIINYVQSLQQQVEFLSMKLATVNPDMNIDIERILSKDIFHARGSNGTVLGFDPGLSSSHSLPHRMFQFQGTMTNMPTTSTQFPPLPQTMLESDLQSLFQMGFDSGLAIDNMGPNGRLKSEL